MVDEFDLPNRAGPPRDFEDFYGDPIAFVEANRDDWAHCVMCRQRMKAEESVAGLCPSCVNHTSETAPNSR